MVGQSHTTFRCLGRPRAESEIRIGGSSGLSGTKNSQIGTLLFLTGNGGRLGSNYSPYHYIQRTQKVCEGTVKNVSYVLEKAAHVNWRVCLRWGRGTLFRRRTKTLETCAARVPRGITSEVRRVGNSGKTGLFAAPSLQNDRH